MEYSVLVREQDGGQELLEMGRYPGTPSKTTTYTLNSWAPGVQDRERPTHGAFTPLGDS